MLEGCPSSCNTTDWNNLAIDYGILRRNFPDKRPAPYSVHNDAALTVS